MGRGNGSGGRARRPMNTAGGRVRRGVAPGGGLAVAEQPAPGAAPVPEQEVFLDWMNRIMGDTPRSVAAAEPELNVYRIGDTLVTEERGTKVYNFGIDGQGVEMTVGRGGAINFKVNGSYNMSYSIPQATENAIATRLLSLMREDAKTRPEGFKYYLTASTGDGNGRKRAVAYTSVGFSRPEEGTAGNHQYGIVQNGKIRPDIATLRENEGARFDNGTANWNNLVRVFRGDRNAERRARRGR